VITYKSSRFPVAQSRGFILFLRESFKEEPHYLCSQPGSLISDIHVGIDVEQTEYLQIIGYSGISGQKADFLTVKPLGEGEMVPGASDCLTAEISNTAACESLNSGSVRYIAFLTSPTLISSDLRFRKRFTTC